jgi:predicted secreted protein
MRKLLLLLLFTTTLFAETSGDVWPYLKQSLFDSREIAEADVKELEITGPNRASSGSQVPVTITVDN